MKNERKTVTRTVNVVTVKQLSDERGETHLNITVLFWCSRAEESHSPMPACHVGSGSHWLQTSSARSPPFLTWREWY